MTKEDDTDYTACSNAVFTSFLDGFIIEKRGPKEGPAVAVDARVNNNIIFRKLKIALNLKSEDVMELMELAEFRLSKHELSAFFRKPDHKHYRQCKDQVLRNFLNGLLKKYHVAESVSVEQWKKKNTAKTYVKPKKEAKRPLSKGESPKGQESKRQDPKQHEPKERALKQKKLKLKVPEQKVSEQKTPKVEKAAAPLEQPKKSEEQKQAIEKAKSKFKF
jgi:uncharacterized protein YehS (DUF1456 family)